MKKIRCLLLLFCVFAILLSFSSCIVWHKRINDIDEEDVASIDIYYLGEDVFDRSGFYLTQTPVHTLDHKQHEAFLDDLGDIVFGQGLILIAANDPSFSYGEWVVRINFTDGSFRFISCAGFGETFDASGELIESDHYGCDDEEWNALIDQYLP